VVTTPAVCSGPNGQRHSNKTKRDPMYECTTSYVRLLVETRTVVEITHVTRNWIKSIYHNAFITNAVLP